MEKIETEEIERKFESNSNKCLMFNCNYKDLTERKYIFIFNFNEEDPQKNLKYINLINEHSIIKYKSDDYDFLTKLLISLKENNKSNLVEVDYFSIKNKNSFNKTIFSNLDIFLNSNVKINISINSFLDIKEYIQYEKRLYDMVKPALNLSPLEKYLYAYNIVKKYKPYKDDEENKFSARNLYELLDSDSMVCVGYANLLVDLLRKLNINAQTFEADTNTSFDNNKLNLEIANDNIAKPNSHKRVCVYLEDEKYNIKGIYYADPTWDNSVEHDAYNHTLMTQEEYDSMDRENYYIKAMDILLDSFSLDEFYEKIKYVFNKNPEMDKKDLLGFIHLDIEYVYPELAEELLRCYRNSESTDKEISDILAKVGNFIITNNNNTIDAKTLFKAVAEVYKANGMTNEEINNILPEVIEYNMKRNRECFPKRFKINYDHNTKEDIKSPYINETNKFDEKENLNKLL